MTNEIAHYLRAFTEQYPDVMVNSAAFAQQGWDSVTLLINGDTILRFARRPDVAVRLAREVALLPRLAAALPLPIPRFEFIGEDTNGTVHFVGYRAIPGAAISLSGEGATGESELAMQLGTFLTALHRFPVSEAQRAGVLGGSVEDWRREYLGLYAEVREHVAPLLTLTEQERVAAFWGHYLDDAANLDFTPTLIHRDLTEEHILMSTETGRLSGIIDWGDASIGDPAMDFAGLSRSLGDAFTQRVFDAYEPAHRIGPETFWRRVRFYAEIGPFYEIIFGRLEGDAGHVEHGLAVLHRTMSGWEPL